MRYVCANLSERIHETEAVITHDPLPVLFVNPVRFQRVLQNLVGNALKYNKKNVRPKVHIGVVKEENTWLFNVKDNGIGMKQEYCEQIFVPFKRLHSKQEYSGTGIGLAICRKIIDNLGGRIWAESEPGTGTVFYFTVPRRMITANEKQREVA